MLENIPTAEHHFVLQNQQGLLYPARDICFADDVQFFGATLEGLQRTGDLVSTHAMLFNLLIVATQKLRAFLSFLPPLPREQYRGNVCGSNFLLVAS